MLVTLARNVHRLQRTWGLSKRATAEVTGVSRRTLDRVLGDDVYTLDFNIQYRPSELTLERIADVFGVHSQDVKKRLPKFVIDTTF